MADQILIVRTIGDRIKAAREWREMTQVQLAVAAGVSSGTIGNAESNARQKPRELSSIAGALRVPLPWLEHGTGLAPWEMPQEITGLHASGDLEAVLLPPVTTWRSLMQGEVPATFRLMLTDDAMAPELRSGTVVIFSSEEAPRPGDAVLVADAKGNLYFREYRTRLAHQWQAVALNQAFAPLDSEADGLQVKAVMIGRLGRRG